MANLEKEYIPAGSYVIESSGGKLLVALLGSSVGVALFDEEAKAGGFMGKIGFRRGGSVKRRTTIDEPDLSATKEDS